MLLNRKKNQNFSKIDVCTLLEEKSREKESNLRGHLLY